MVFTVNRAALGGHTLKVHEPQVTSYLHVDVSTVCEK